jgi:Domain of unknown function (DUF4129)
VRLSLKASFLLAVFIVLGTLAVQAGPGRDAIPEEAYFQKLAETQSLVTSLRTASPDEVLNKLTPLAVEWEQINGIRLESGEVVPLDHRYFASQLRANPPKLEQLAGQLVALQLQLDKPLTLHTPDHLVVLENILKRPEFQWAEAQPSFWEQFWDWVWDGISRLLSWLLPDQVLLPGSELAGNVITFLGAIVFAVVIVLIGRELMNSFVAENKALSADAQADEVITADVAFARAQALSSSGDHRLAVRYLYLSALLLLDERGLLRYDRTLTNREYLQTVAHLPEVAATLREVVEVFDNVWYGYHTIDAAAFEQYAARVGRLRQQR